MVSDFGLGKVNSSVQRGRVFINALVGHVDDYTGWAVVGAYHYDQD